MESPTSQGLPTQYYPYLPQDIPDPESNPFPTEWQPSQDLDSDLVLLTMDPSSTQFQGDFSLDLLSYISPTHLYTSDSDPLARYENNLTHFAESFFEYDHNLNVLEEPNSVIGPWHPTDMGSAIQPESVVVPTSSEHSSTIPEASERATTMDSVENSDQITYSCTFAGCQRTFCKRCLLNAHTRLHTRPKRCPHPSCDYRTARKKEIDRHVIAKHPNPASPVARSKCSVKGCKGGIRGFTRKDNLRKHMKKYH